jgi:hypothetical protein
MDPYKKVESGLRLDEMILISFSLARNFKFNQTSRM